MPTTAHGRAELDARLYPAPINPLAERLERVTHLYLNLSVDSKGDCHRPNVTIWPAADEDAPPAVVTMLIGSMFGQQARYLDMAPDEARTLARHLINTADLIDRAVAETAR